MILKIKQPTEQPKKKGKATELSEKIAERLLALRSRYGLTQRAMAEKIDVTFQQYQKYEKAKDRLSLERALVLCRQLEIPLSVFSDDAGNASGFAETDQASFGTAPKMTPKARAEEDELLILFRSVTKKSRKDFMAMAQQTAKLLSAKN